jgi:phosphoglycerate dehydrogenase-like enzyme
VSSEPLVLLRISQQCCLAGKTLGIVGYGHIGQACGRLAKAFGMHIVALRRNPTISEEEKAAGVFSEVFPVSELQTMIPRCDYIIMAMPLTKETHKFFGAAAFAAMGEHSVFINIGRGKTVDEEALISALQNGECSLGDLGHLS